MSPLPRRHLVLLSLAAAAVLAGCVGAGPGDLAGSSGDAPDTADETQDRLTRARFEEILHHEMHVQTSSDQRIQVDVWRPDVTNASGDASDWKAPTILVYSPYFGFTQDPTGRSDDPTFGGFYSWMLENLTARGYAVVLADVRGTRESEGCIDVAGPKEVRAGAQVVEALHDADWSNGKVGMFGVSYPARTQYGVATLDPEGLETIVPVAGISDYYTYFYYQGVPREGNNPGTIAGYTAISLIPHPTKDGLTAYPDRANPECHGPQARHAADLSGEWDSFWAERDYNADADQVEASVWMIHGWEDWNVIPRSALEYFRRVDAPKKAWLLQMEHNYPDDNSHEPSWSRSDFRRKLHAWYDQTLLDRDLGALEGPPVHVQDSSGRWRETETWPPEDRRTRTFRLGADGGLGGDVEAGTRTYLALGDHDGRSAPGPADTRLVYTSQPLQEDLHLAGSPTLQLTAALEGRSTHVMWRLEAVEPGDGDATLVTRGYLDTRYRDGVRNGSEPMEPGGVELLTVDGHPQDDVVPAGHKLRLAVSGDDPHTYPDTSEGAARSVTVHHGASPTLLRLPVVDPPADAYFRPPMEAPSQG